MEHFLNNHKIEAESIGDNIVVEDQANKNIPVEVELGSDSESIIVKPPLEGYQYDHIYTLKIKRGVKSTRGKC